MKKRTRVFLISVVCMCVFSLFVGALVYKCFYSTGTLTIIPESDIGVNYNNYVAGEGTLDYRYGKFAWHNGNTLTVVDDTGDLSTQRWGNYSFQIYKDGIVHLQFDELIITDENKESRSVAKNVNRFIILENSLLYSSESGDVECLYLYDLETMIHTKLIEADFVISLCVNDDRVYVLTDSATSKEMLTVFENGVIVDNTKFNVSHYPFYLMTFGETLVYRDGNALAFYDINTKETSIIKISDRTTVDDFVYILNDEFAIVSYRALNYNGCFTSTEKCESNGLWLIDLSTM